MKHPHLASYVRSHRKKAGLSQKELARILNLDQARVSRHERADIEPPLCAALGYEAVFGVSVRRLYPRMYEMVKAGIEDRLLQLESELQQTGTKGRQASTTARKLEWLCERKNSIINLA